MLKEEDLIPYTLFQGSNRKYLLIAVGYHKVFYVSLFDCGSMFSFENVWDKDSFMKNNSKLTDVETAEYQPILNVYIKR